MDECTVMKQWNYLASEPFQMRYLLVAGLLRKFENILEIGSYKTPIFQFIDDADKNIITLDPMVMDLKKSASQGSRMLDYRCLEMTPFEGEEFALVILGLDLPINGKLKSFMTRASLVIIEFPEDHEWKRSREKYDNLVAELGLNEMASVSFGLEDNDFSMFGGEDEWPPRTQRFIKVCSKPHSKLSQLNGHNPFVSRLPEISTAQSKLIDTEFANKQLLQEADYEFSHGANSSIGYLGGGMLYYSLVYMFRPQVCVCLGSGGAFVPRLMRQAQRDMGLVEHTRTILVDGNMANYGRPNWLDENSFFRMNYADVEVNISRTDDAAKVFKKQNLKIDYLHLDADHSYEGSLNDFNNFLPLMNPGAIITFHDTKRGSHEEVTCWKAIEEIRSRGFEILNFDQLGAGVAIIKVPDSVPMALTNPISTHQAPCSVS
ncbi:MAG: class I SAM-dependent methyltransferase [Planctomycetota bacterium]